MAKVREMVLLTPQQLDTLLGSFHDPSSIDKSHISEPFFESLSDRQKADLGQLVARGLRFSFTSGELINCSGDSIPGTTATALIPEGARVSSAEDTPLSQGAPAGELPEQPATAEPEAVSTGSDTPQSPPPPPGQEDSAPQPEPRARSLAPPPTTQPAESNLPERSEESRYPLWTRAFRLRSNPRKSRKH